jgi:hypothetical protein
VEIAKIDLALRKEELDVEAPGERKRGSLQVLFGEDHVLAGDLVAAGEIGVRDLRVVGAAAPHHGDGDPVLGAELLEGEVLLPDAGEQRNGDVEQPEADGAVPDAACHGIDPVQGTEGQRPFRRGAGTAAVSGWVAVPFSGGRPAAAPAAAGDRQHTRDDGGSISSST